MKKIFPYLNYFLFWIFFFIITRSVFLVYHHTLTLEIGVADVFKIFFYGLRMDASFAAYICIFPFMLFLIQALLPRFNPEKIIGIYTITIIILLSFITTADLELYNSWGYRMDATPLQYLKSPKEMAGSVSSAPLLLLLFIFCLLSILFMWVYKKGRKVFLISANTGRLKIGRIAIAVFLVAVLFIPLRGGIQKIPLNQSDVYFSQNIFADHAALNLPWNLMHSILNRNSDVNPFNYLPPQVAEKLVDSLYNTHPQKIPSIVSVEKPNIIFIIMESFTAKLVGCLGGEAGVTPNIDRIASEGLLFTNIYAAGDRSEKGQVAILSGYPNQAITSIIKTPTKTQHLPSINRALDSIGYHSSYTYGGELEFANIKSFLLNVGFQQLVSKYSFPSSQRTTSWGVHDHIVLDRFYNDLKKETQPFFATIFTLSSHEPFDVPMAPRFKGKDETTLFKNSIAYTDSAIGNFIERIKKEPWWQNTLIVLVADHGHPLPGYDANELPSKFHIPLIFTGGALKLKGVIETIGSQTDIATTILHQAGLPTNNFKWGKDLLDSSARSFAFYTFNNGFGFVSPTGIVAVDNVSRKVIYTNGSTDSNVVNAGKAYMQQSYQDFLNR